ncbi:hypothetical protein FRC11_001955, partial [Ceratobasidium sp. 423]
MASGIPKGERGWRKMVKAAGMHGGAVIYDSRYERYKGMILEWVDVVIKIEFLRLIESRG